MSRTIKQAHRNIKRAVSSSIDSISDNFDEYTTYKSNYDYLLDLPIVRQLVKENRRLKSDNARLLDVLLYASEFHDSVFDSRTEKPKTNTKRSKLYRSSSSDKRRDTSTQTDADDDGVEIVDSPLVVAPLSDNIIYLLHEDESESSGEVYIKVEPGLPDTLDEVQVGETDEYGEDEESSEDGDAQASEAGEDDDAQASEEEEAEVDEEAAQASDAGEEEASEDEEEAQASEAAQAGDVQASEAAQASEDEEEEEEDEEEEEEAQASEAAQASESEEEEEEEMFEVVIQGKVYYTPDTKSGIIYDVDDEGDATEVGKFVNGKAQL